MATERRIPNPYRPGFNQQPAELVGREAVLDAAREALDVAALDARTPRPLVLVGVRGVGKTVTIGEIAAIAAAEQSWLTAHVECVPRVPVDQQLAAELERAHELLTEHPQEAEVALSETKLRANVLGLGGEARWTRQPRRPSYEGQLEGIMERVSHVAAERDTGLVVAIDELQQVRGADLAAVTSVLQRHVPDNWPLVVVVAGLPTIRDPRRTVTYLERGEWHELGMLTRDDTIRALTEPAESAGRPMTPAAAQLLADVAGGYPYAVQIHGHHAWRASKGSDAITEQHAHASLAAAERDLATGLYAARWHGASPGEQDYLRSLAALQLAADQAGRPVTNSDVAEDLGRTTTQLSPVRDRLLKKGTIFAEGKTLRFCVPGMARWITETNAKEDTT